MAPEDERDFRTLPEPVRLEDTVTSQDVVVPQDEGDEELREAGWLLRTAGGL